MGVSIPPYSDNFKLEVVYDTVKCTPAQCHASMPLLQEHKVYIYFKILLSCILVSYYCNSIFMIFTLKKTQI